MGYDKNILLKEDEKNVKRWTGEFKENENKFYKEIFENHLL
jgi:hypothetical protein